MVSQLLEKNTSRGCQVESTAIRTRVAVLSTWHPEPADNGRKQRTQQLIAALAQDYEVVLISLLDADTLAGTALPAVPGVWRQWALPLPVFHPRSFANVVAGLHPLPRSTVATWRPATASGIADILAQTRSKLAIGTDLRTLRYLLAIEPGVSTIWDEPDVSPFICQPADRRTGNGRLRAYGRQWKFRRLLRQAAQRLDAVLVASPQEEEAYRQLSGSSCVTLVENGIGALPAPAWSVPNSAQLIYSGALSYAPNAEAMSYFADDILPLIATSVPDVRLLVTGKIPPASHPLASQSRVSLSGWLDEDGLGAAYRGSRVAVIPLLSGTGTRIKLLEALAYGLPVVTTTKGAEGLDVISGEHLVIADTPAEFAAVTVRLLTDDALAQQLGARGREHVRQRYSWDTRGVQLRDLVRDCLHSASAGG